MSALEKDRYWMCFTPYRPEVVGQEENVIFGPTTLHGDAIRMKCKQMNITNFEVYIDKILDITHSIISKKSFITESELEDLIKKEVG